MDLPTKTIYSVPRTLDLASVMVLTAGYAFLIAGLQRLTFDDAAIAYVVSLITCVGIGQAVFLKSKAPRVASLLIGVVFGLAFSMFWTRSFFRRSDFGHWMLRFLPPGFFDSWLWLIGAGISFGLIVGYLAGACVGGAFLVSHHLRSFMFNKFQRNVEPNAEVEH
jgi:hypothetical protein